MAKKKVAIIVASAVMALAALIAGIVIFSGAGSLKMTDFVVNASNAKTVYEVGETVSFDGLEMKAFFNDETTDDVALTEVKIYLGEEEITTNLSKITETKGVKTVKVVYTTKYGEDFAEFTVTVNEEVELLSIIGFNEPTFLSDFKANVNAATNDKTAENFEQKFFKNEGTEYYVVGDDNAFKFLPIAQVFNEDDASTETLTSFKANSTVKVWDGTAFVALTKQAKAGAEFVYEYLQGTNVLVTEDAANNTFDFADGTVGSIFSISVKPDSNSYEFDEDEVQISVKVVDAFNVYKAGELSVFDNTQTEWNAIKTSNGVANVATNGVVLHQNTILKAEDIPSEFYYTLPENYNIKYKDAATGTIGSPEDFGLTRTFLWNQYDGNPVMFQRTLQAGESFSFYGNYFDLDVSKMPLVCSFWADGAPGDEDDTYYGGDFSNTSLFRAEGQGATTGDADEHFNFYNLAMKGNAKPDQLVLSSTTTGQHTDETLIYAGGLICTKVDSMAATYDNVRTYNFFISLFAESEEDGVANVDYNRTKVYDSFQDALFLWGNAHANITNSYMKGAGGPLVLMQHVDPQTNTVDIPTLTVDETSEMEAYLTGSEIWFTTVGGGSFIEQLQYLDTQLFNAMGKTIFVGKTTPGSGKMNIVALLTCSGNNASDVLTSTEVQGSVNYKGYIIDRMATSAVGAQIHGIMGVNAAAPIFSFGDSIYYYTGGAAGLPVIATVAGTDGMMEMAGKAATSQYFSFHMGGISVLFELGNYPAA